MSDLLNQASLVMVPSGYKEDVVYSAVPTNGNGDLSFTRASNGTRVNSAGLVEVVPWNLASYSEDFTNVIWESVAVSITANTTTAPNGTTTADTATISASGAHNLKEAISVVPNSVYTFSFYAKRGTATDLSYSVFDTINVQNIVIPTSYYSQTSSSEWARISVIFTTPNNCTQLYVYPLRDGNSTGTVFLWGAQLNIGSTAKPYFPTTDRLNVPRLTYQNGGGGCPSLLLEKQSTNLFTYSEQMDNSDWFKNNLTITANSTTSPDGTQNADLLDDGTASSTQHWIYQGTSFSNSTAYTISFYAKYVSRKYMAVNIYNGATSQYVVYDIQNGSVYGSTGDVTASITSVGNGWYRVVYTRTMSASGSPNFRIAMADDSGNETYTGSNKQVYLWGCQCEASSYPTSYIPTTSSSATRVADACSKTGISSLIGSGTGTWFMDFEMVQGTGTGNPFAFDLSDGTTSNRLFLYWGESAQTWNWGGIDTAITLPSTLRKKVAIKYSSGTAKLFCNGSSISTLSISTAFSRLDIGQRFSNTFPMDGKINQAYFLTTSLTDAECQAITTI